MAEPRFDVTDRFEPLAMQAFMRRPDIYWPATDALAPPPEAMDFVGHMAHNDTYTMGCTFNGHIVGYVQFVRRTAIGSEIHCGFHPQFRGKIAKHFVQHCIAYVFKNKGLLKLWAPIPSDNKAALMMARMVGARQEGRLTRAIVRSSENHDGPPLCDLVIMALSKE